MNGPTFAQPATPATARPAGGAPPRSARGPAKPDPDAGAGLRVLTYLKLHWLTVLFCGTLVGGAGSYAAWELLPPKWESTALLQVDQTPPSLANPGGQAQGRSEFGTYVKTAAQILRSEYVLNAALREVKDVPTIKEQKDPIKYLLEKLQVTTQEGSELITIRLEGDDPADVKKIVDAVQRAYTAEVVERDKLRRAELLKQSADAHADLMNRLRTKAVKPELARGPTDPAVQPAAAGGPKPLPPLGGTVPPPVAPPAADPLALMAKVSPTKITDQYALVAADLAQLPGRIQALRRKAEALKARVEELKKAPITDPTVLAALEADPDVKAQARAVARAVADYDVAYGTAADKNCPDVRTKKAIWDGQKERLKEVRARRAFQLEGATRVPEMKARMAAAEEALQQAEELEGRLKIAQAVAPGLVRVMGELADRPEVVKAAAGGRIEREKPYNPEDTDTAGHDAVFGAVTRNMVNFQVELNSLGRVRVIQTASAPIQKDSKKQVMAAVAAGLLGYVLLAVGLVGYETLARRVSALGDVTAAGPAPVVGVIPYRPGAGQNGVARQAAAAEAVDKLRAYVGQTWLGRGAGCVAVTSPVGDEGKGFAAYGLADSLARAGYKALLVDFDLRAPGLHTLAGVANSVGVCEALRGEIVDARDAVVSLPSGLDLLPAGAWSEAAGRAAVGRRLDELLARLREPYDCVVVNAHAVLAAAEAVEVVRRCEAVLVCAQYRETTVPLLRRATDRVAAMEVPYAGVVYVGGTDREALC